MQSYLALCRRIINEGQWMENTRTGKRCLTVINVDLEFDAGGNNCPVVTTRRCFWKPAVAELLGYLRGYSNAMDFKELGAPTWLANANDNQSWLNNPHRRGENDMGRVYGVQGRGWRGHDDKEIDQLGKVVQHLKDGIDDRGEIVTFYNPGEFELGCLRPCMHTHTFSLLGDTLHLTSYQRSCDVPLGLTFNQIQVYCLLRLIAQITGHKAGKAYLKIVNAHIYEDQLPLMRDVQLIRQPYKPPTLVINPDISSLEDLETWVSLEDFRLENYQHHPAIQYPFSV